MIKKVFGIGLSKTGTTSLNAALEILGYKSIHYPPLDQLFSLLSSNDAATDTPVACCFKELLQIYPDAQFIYTQRDQDAWLQSARSEFAGRPVFEPWKREVRRRLYGSIEWDEGSFRAGYLRHHQHVQAVFAEKQQQLLSIDLVGGAGWQQICSFLNRSIPTRPFPHLNASGSRG